MAQAYGAQNRRNRLIQNLLLVLVCVALCAVVVEAIFIYKLYNKCLETDHESSSGTESDAGAQVEPNSNPRKQKLPAVLTPLKPLAHLKDALGRPEDGVMQWDKNLDSTIHQLEHRDGRLVVQKEGFYYIYSKISFSPEDIFIHTVRKTTPRYAGEPFDLLRDRRYPQDSTQKDSIQNSFLGGVFHLHKNDAIFVHVSKSLLVRLQISADNYFGMFML